MALTHSYTEEFLTQFTARSAEVEATKFDLEQLMVRADRFCANSGLRTFDVQGLLLVVTGPDKACTSLQRR
jgi:hypothetical protein